MKQLRHLEMSGWSDSNPNDSLEQLELPGRLENTLHLIENLTSQSVKYDPEVYFDDINKYVKDNWDAIDCLCHHKILLSSPWATKREIRCFCEYPGILYVDTTNIESRPFLMICGKDADGKIFVLLQIYLCNECAWQFRCWCFSHVLPLVIGKESIQRVRYIITDGDWNEYIQIDYAIQRSFPNALRGRCAYHIVDIPQGRKERTPRSDEFDNEEIGEEGCKVIKQWIYIWMNAAGGCETHA
jgi:hypothetical protein